MKPHAVSHRALGFNLMEVLVALAIFTVGMVAIAAIFPAAIYLQKQTIADASSQQVARNAAAIMQAQRLTYNEVGPTGNLVNYYYTAGPALRPAAELAWVRSLIAGGNLVSADTVELEADYPLDTRSYLSLQSDVNKRDYYWWPFVQDRTGDPLGVDTQQWSFFIFVLARGGGAVPEVWEAGVTPDATDASRLNFGTAPILNNDADADETWDYLQTGDWLLDNVGVIYQITEVGADYVRVKPNVPTAPAPQPTKIYYGRASAPEGPNPAALVMPVNLVVTDP